MDKVYQIFVSSTYADLSEERRRVSETLAKAGFVPAGMELFPATDQQQLDFIQRVIDRCDYYVVVVGGKYGSLADDNISFTEKEYEYALAKGIPILAFLHANPDKIEAGKIEQSRTRAKKLEAFRDRLAHGRLVDFWLEPQELCTKVVIAVVQATNLSPRTGWVRGDKAIDPIILQEAERLRIENEELKSRIAELISQEITFPPHLAGPDDSLQINIAGTFYGDTFEHSIQLTWERFFFDIIEFVLRELPEAEISSRIAKNYVRSYHAQDFKNDRDYYIVHGDMKKIRFHLEALGLIKAVARGESALKSYIAWALTEKGRQFIAYREAIRRPPDD